jgi:hypothetical protein
VSASISQLIPELRDFATDLVRAAGAAGLQPRITSTRRSRAEQTRLYRRYQQGLNPYPVAPPGTSSHEFGFAFDLVVSPMDAIVDVGAYWEAQGGVWGGRFNDPIHFEYPGFKESGTSSILSGSVEAVGNVISEAAQFINSLPWYVTLVMPTALMTKAPNENMDDFAARVMRWVNSHF